MINDASKEKPSRSFVKFVCIFEKVDQVEFGDQQDIDPFQDEALLQSVMDYCLSIKSLLCTKYILDRLREDKIEPVVGIKALSEVIQGISSLQDLSESSHSMSKEQMAFCRAKDAYSDDISGKFEESGECISILKALVEKKNCTLRYGSDSEGVSDMLKLIYHKLGQDTIQTDPKRRLSSKEPLKENFESDPINDSKSEENLSIKIEDIDTYHNKPVKIKCYPNLKKLRKQSFDENTPKLNPKNLQKIDTLRVK